MYWKDDLYICELSATGVSHLVLSQSCKYRDCSTQKRREPRRAGGQIGTLTPLSCWAPLICCSTLSISCSMRLAQCIILRTHTVQDGLARAGRKTSRDPMHTNTHTNKQTVHHNLMSFVVKPTFHKQPTQALDWLRCGVKPAHLGELISNRCALVEHIRSSSLVRAPCFSQRPVIGHGREEWGAELTVDEEHNK